MTRAKISEYSATAGDNTDVNGVNIAEGCPPSSMNNMGREIMAALKRYQVGSDGDGVTVGGNLVVSGTTALSTALPVASGGTGITSLGTGVATFLGTPSSANLLSAITDETGTGELVFATSPTLVTPVLGTPTSGTLTNTTGLPLSTGVTGTLPVANGGTGATTLTAENVILGDGTNAVKFVSPGTSGNVLTSNGTTWTSAGLSGSALTLLSTVTASSSATVDIETTFNSTYDVYWLVASGITPSVTNAVVAARLKIGGTYITSGTYPAFRMQPESQQNSFAGAGDTAASEIRIIGNVNNVANASANFSMYIFSPSSTALSKMIVWTGASVDTTTFVRLSYGAGFNTGTSAMTGIRFFLLSGNIASGTFRLYGIAKS